MRTAIVTLSALGALLAGGAAHAQADSTGPYLLAAGGASSYDTNCTGLPHCESSAGAYKLALGMRVLPGLGFEALWTDFGKISASDGNVNGGTGELQVRAAGAAATFTSEWGGGWRNVIRLGLVSVSAKGTSLINGVPVAASSERSLEGYFGISFGYAFTRNLAIEAGWDATRGSLDGNGGRVGAATVGLLLSF